MKVRIIAPSSSCINADLKLNQAIELLTSNGFVVSHPQNLFAKERLPFYSNTREERSKDLRDAILDEEIDIIWAFRGGYGAAEIVEDAIELKNLITKHKLLIGFSDITALHILWNQEFNMKSLHASVLTSLLSGQASHINCIKHILSGAKHSVEITPINQIALNTEVKGEIVGGNACVLQTMIGTKLHPKTKDKIIFLEDVNEEGYKVARILNHIEKAGLLDNVKACIIGDFTHPSDLNIEYALNDFVNRHKNIPIYKIASGHNDVNHPIIMGGEVIISNGFLEYIM